MAHLNKSQKKRINQNKIKKELNQANPITCNKITMVDFNDNPFRDN